MEIPLERQLIHAVAPNAQMASVKFFLGYKELLRGLNHRIDLQYLFFSSEELNED